MTIRLMRAGTEIPEPQLSHGRFNMQFCKPQDQLSVLDRFHVAAGTITGRRHLGSGNLLSGGANQDAFSCSQVDQCILLSIHDGCGSAPFSQFGARFASLISPAAVAKAINQYGFAQAAQPEFWQLVEREYIERLALLAALSTQELDLGKDLLSAKSIEESCSSCDYSEFVKTHLLFTILGALITPKMLVVFGMGDGVFSINGSMQTIGPFPDNAPDYLSKALIDEDYQGTISVHESMSIHELDSLVLGTDGLSDLVRHSDSFIPGKSRRVGALKQIFAQPALFNSIRTFAGDKYESLTGWLRLVNSEVVRLSHDDEGLASIRREEGLLPDDTTLLALRRVS